MLSRILTLRLASRANRLLRHGSDARRRLSVESLEGRRLLSVSRQVWSGLRQQGEVAHVDVRTLSRGDELRETLGPREPLGTLTKLSGNKDSVSPLPGTFLRGSEVTRRPLVAIDLKQT
ncbi:MAG: hypothetical protein KDA92_25125, partial [Planctomycetales bacterium]|nr:hypothetical protein [Planctomycetales bacterium]